MKVGFIGLGIMGEPMAGHLIKGGHKLYLRTRRQAPADLVAAGGTACGSPAEVAERADVIITMVPDTPDVEKVLFGPDGVVEGLYRQDDRRHELDLAYCDQGVCQADQRARLRLSRCPGIWR